MPDLACYHLEFTNGLHLGSGGDLEETRHMLPSDTLFAAWVDACLRLGMDPAELCAPFAAVPADPPFLLTSAFPRAGNLRFYPVPGDLSRILSPETIRNRDKAVRRMRYFSEGLLRRALAREPLDGYLFPSDAEAEPVNGAALQNGALWFTLSEHDLLPPALRRPAGRRHALRRLTVWSEQQLPRVTVDRINSASTIFHAGKVFFSEGCGLWFGLEWRRPQATLAGSVESFEDAFKRGLEALQVDGLGGERSLGYGVFRVAPPSPVSLPGRPAGGELLYLLSRYHPTAVELPTTLADHRAAYALTTVGGWLRSPDGPAQRRKRLRLVAEGGLVCPSAYPAGDVVDVRPDYENPAGMPIHPVYRYGLTQGLPWPEAEAGYA